MELYAGAPVFEEDGVIVGIFGAWRGGSAEQGEHFGRDLAGSKSALMADLFFGLISRSIALFTLTTYMGLERCTFVQIAEARTRHIAHCMLQSAIIKYRTSL